jgi:hypothetical protein
MVVFTCHYTGIPLWLPSGSQPLLSVHTPLNITTHDKKERMPPMNRIRPENNADLFFQINWSSKGANHTDAYSGLAVNFWRDILPSRLHEDLLGARTGDTIELTMPAAELFDACDQPKPLVIGRNQFDAGRVSDAALQPRTGRFYPKGILKDIAGIFSVNMEPFRCVQVVNGHLGVELGHPLAGKKVTLKATVGSVRSKIMERGGSLRHWGEEITRGVGMQARWNGVPTDFFSDGPFRRKDETLDTQFYRKPRLVQHIDDAAIGIIKQIYGRFVESGMRVLDLMSSWQSHLPEGLRLKEVIGLGLNVEELNRNPVLNDHVVHDVNSHPELPFETAHFDVAVCTVSVEYLTRPMDVFAEVARVLKPQGWFVVTFSNRWFDPKSITIWPQLHEFERMGLVLEYFHGTSDFSDLHTYSVRGLERPSDDKYAGRIPYADPVYAVWGRRK